MATPWAECVGGDRFRLVANDGQSAEGHLDDISSVQGGLVLVGYGQRQNVALVVSRLIHGTERYTLTVSLRDGRTLTLVARDAPQVSEQLERFCADLAQHQLARAREAIARGETVRFGPRVTLGPDTLQVGGRTIPLAEITGYMLGLYVLMIDRRYRLVASIKYLATPNFDTLLALLDDILPGKNLGSSAHDPQPKVPWHAVSAAKHDPTSLSLRARLGVLAILPTLLALYALAMLVPARAVYDAERAEFEAFNERESYVMSLAPTLTTLAAGPSRRCAKAASPDTPNHPWLTLLAAHEGLGGYGVVYDGGDSHRFLSPVRPDFLSIWVMVGLDGGRKHRSDHPTSARWTLFEDASASVGAPSSDEPRAVTVRYVVAEADRREILCAGSVEVKTSGRGAERDMTAALIAAAGSPSTTR